MNRTTPRAEYLAIRTIKRADAGHRTDRGLPHHPDGSGFAPCQRCCGTGVIDVPHWHPELVESFNCGECCGSGTVDDGHRDPLLRLRFARQRRNRLRNPAAYTYLRRLSATPSPVPAGPSRDAPPIPFPESRRAGVPHLEICA